MGGALKTVGGGINSVLSPLGLGGEQGAYAQANNYNPALDQINQYNAASRDAGITNSLQDYANGKSSVSDLQNRYGGSTPPAEKSALNDQLATSGLTGSKYATEQVQNNPILGQLFGNGGELSSSIAKEQQLQNQGFQLTPEDREAYGQASGDIARLFGAQEQGASQSLADRGLGAAPSGAASMAFSGLQGNKNEMLAKSQMDIANQRMQNTMQRIGQQQGFISQLGSQGQNAIQQQYGRQLAGVQNNQDQLNKAAGLNTEQNNAANQANMASMQDQRGAAGKTLFGAVGQNLYGQASGDNMKTLMAGGKNLGGSAAGSGAA